MSELDVSKIKQNVLFWLNKNPENKQYIKQEIISQTKNILSSQGIPYGKLKWLKPRYLNCDIIKNDLKIEFYCGEDSKAALYFIENLNNQFNKIEKTILEKQLLNLQKFKF